MNDLTMTKYISKAKSYIDAITTAGSHLDNDDIIHYILNGLPPSYQAFKTSIRTNLQPIHIDDFYSLLFSEEANLAHEVQHDLLNTQSNTLQPALNIQLNRRTGRNFSNKTRTTINPPTNTSSNHTNRNSRSPITCQLCHKLGHSAHRCWHRTNLNYQPSPSPALMTSQTSTPSTEWILDTGATNHLTPDARQLYHPQPYHGNQQIMVGNGQTLPIANTGHGLLPTPIHKLHLSPLFHVPHLTHNLIYVQKLLNDNSCSISFNSSGYTIRDRNTNIPLLHGSSRNGLYQLSPASSTATSALATLLVASSARLPWHERLGHPQLSTLQLISRANPHLGITATSTVCIPCHQAKSHKLPFPISSTKCNFPFTSIPTQPSQTQSRSPTFIFDPNLYPRLLQPYNPTNSTLITHPTTSLPAVQPSFIQDIPSIQTINPTPPSNDHNFQPPPPPRIP